MKTIRTIATIKGVKTTMLFTPRLFEFKTASMDFTDAGNAGKVAGMYADLAYCAALNYWTLEEHDVAEFELKRADFHEWAVIAPADFGKVMKISLEALTNKSLEELLSEQKGAEKAGTEVKKKKTSISIIQRLRLFWSAIVG